MNPVDDDDATHVRMDAVNEDPTEQHYDLYTADPITERIPPAPFEEQPYRPLYVDEVRPSPPPPPINYPPPPPPIIYPPMPAQNPQGLYPPPSKRSRAGLAFLIMGVLVLGVFAGFFFASLAASQQYEAIEPVVEVSTKTATATKTVTKTKTRTVTPPPPTATATETKEIQAPGDTRTVEKTKTPQSCLNAVNAGQQYMALAQQGGVSRGRGRISRLTREARDDFQYWSDQCRNDS